MKTKFLRGCRIEKPCLFYRISHIIFEELGNFVLLNLITFHIHIDMNIFLAVVLAGMDEKEYQIKGYA